MNVYVNDKLLGKVRKIENHNGNEILVVSVEKDYLIPYNFDIISINLTKKELLVKDIPGLF